jgi:hypothetical protein
MHAAPIRSKSDDPRPMIPCRTPTKVAAVDDQMQGDFFGMFDGLSSQAHQTTTAYAPLLGAASAASAMIGGFWSVLDTAYAVLNEEFDSNDNRNPSSNSIISDSSIEDMEGGLRIADSRSNTTKSQTDTNINRHRNNSTKLDENTKRSSSNNQNKVSDPDQLPTRGELMLPCIYIVPFFLCTIMYNIIDFFLIIDVSVTANKANEISIERFPSQNIGYYTPQNSLTGSISALQLLYEGGSDEIYLDVPLNHGVKWKKTTMDDCHDLFSDLIDDDEMNEWDDDSDYCIIKDEKETHDGWMVISDN